MTDTERSILLVLVDMLRQNIVTVDNLNIIARREHCLQVSDECTKISARFAGMRVNVENLLD
jgi:hypothetical protein